MLPISILHNILWVEIATCSLSLTFIRICMGKSAVTILGNLDNHGMPLKMSHEECLGDRYCTFIDKSNVPTI